MLPPDEMGVLHDYGQVIIDQADAATCRRARGSGRQVQRCQWDVSDVTGGKKLSIEDDDRDGRRPDGHHHARRRARLADRDAARQPAIVLNEDTIDTYLTDAIGGADLDQQVLDIIKREFKQIIGLGIVTVQVDGKWYVSPIRSVSDIFVSLLKGLEPGDVDYLINLAKN